jgi:hypothetical protein
MVGLEDSKQTMEEDSLDIPWERKELVRWKGDGLELENPKR